MSKLICDLGLLVVSTLILTTTTAIALRRRSNREERLGATVLAALALIFIALLALPFLQTP